MHKMYDINFTIWKSFEPCQNNFVDFVDLTGRLLEPKIKPNSEQRRISVGLIQ